MRKYAKFQNLGLLSLLAFASHAMGATSTCPSTILSDLCEKLTSHEDGDWISCKVVFNRPPMDPKTDPAKDTTPVASDTATPPYLVEYTQAMFGKYDFRLWDDHSESSTVDGGAIPPWSSPARVEGSYRGFATKNTILSLAAESYIQGVEDWQAPVPTSLFRAQRLFSRPAGLQPFNIKGQRLGTANVSTFLIRGIPNGR